MPRTFALGLVLVALAGFAAWARWRERLSPGASLVVLSLLTTLVFAVYVGQFRFSPERGLEASVAPPHAGEFIAYYLGTKYFAETGYRGLYDAAVAADHEDVPEHFDPKGLVRNLETYGLEYRGQALARAENARARFSPARWESFKADLAILRSTVSPEEWHEVGWYADHGYNGTPLSTAVLGGLANLPWIDASSFIGLSRFADLYLLLLVAALLAGLERATLGLCFLFLLFANPLNDAQFIGASYLRFDYLVALGLGLYALRARRLATAGVLLAVTGWIRVFPLVIPALLLARDGFAAWRGVLPRERLRLHAGFAAASVVVLLGTSAVATPDGRNPWLAFAANMQLHAGTPGGNQIGLQVPLRYSASNDVRIEAYGTTTAPLGWREEVARTLATRRVATALGGLLLVGVAVARFWRVGDAALLPCALLLVFVVMPLAHYYWALLSLVPLAARDPDRWNLPLAATFAALAVTLLPPVLAGREDLRFALASLEVGAFLLFALWWTPRGEAADVA